MRVEPPQDVAWRILDEVMRPEALDAAVEMERFAAKVARLLYEPIEEPTAATRPPRRLRRYEIVHVYRLSPRNHLGESATCNGPNLIVHFQECNPTSRRHLPPKAGKKILPSHVRPKFVHDRKTPQNQLVAISLADGWHDAIPYPR